MMRHMLDEKIHILKIGVKAFSQAKWYINLFIHSMLEFGIFTYFSILEISDKVNNPDIFQLLYNFLLYLVFL